jgi:thiosulfate/3-mercaptopyruvate sulfurtransferase
MSDRENYLVSVSALAEECHSAKPPIIIDCRYDLAEPQRGEDAFLQGHIPSAQYWHLSRDLSGDLAAGGAEGGRHPLPTPESFQHLVADTGIGRQTSVVVYDDQGGAFAARVWWLLRFFGHPGVRLLDGGWSAWCSAGLPLESGSATKLASLRDGLGEPDLSHCVDYEWVKGHLSDPSVILVDGRAEARFLGLSEPIDPVAGHIPGALNKPISDAISPDGFWLPEASQRARWNDVDPQKQVIHYCGSGVSACVNSFSRCLAGLPEGRLYVGSWSEWCRRETSA